MDMYMHRFVEWQEIVNITFIYNHIYIIDLISVIFGVMLLYRNFRCLY